MNESSDAITTQTLTGRLRKQSFGFWFIVCISFLAAAQIVRNLVLYLDAPTFLNEKFAFSLNVPTPLMYLLYLVAVAFIVHHLYHWWHKMFAVTKLGFLLIVTGGLSNFLERIIFGHVVDYVFIGTGVLNLADFYIIFGIVLIFVKRGFREEQLS